MASYHPLAYYLLVLTFNTCFSALPAVTSHRNPDMNLALTCRVVGRHGMVCNELPQVIPPNITTVSVLQHKQSDFEGQFLDSSWRGVKVLSVQSADVQHIRDFQLSPLVCLSELYLVMPNLNDFTQHSLAGLANLAVLSVAQTTGLHMATLQGALYSDLPPYLAEFTVNTGRAFNVPVFPLDKEFKSLVFKSQIMTLNLSNLLIVTTFAQLFEVAIKIDVLNMSDSYVLPPTAFQFPRVFTANSRRFLKTLDISGLKAPKHNELFRPPGILDNVKNLARWIFMIENIYFNRLLRVDFHFNEMDDFRDTNVLTRTIHGCCNNILRLDGHLLFNETNRINLVDLSRNKLEYINPKMFSSMINLKYLYLSSNRLYLMESTTTFSTLFNRLRNLNELYLADNNLSCIPRDTFLTNGKLHTLDLGSNKLSSIMFNLTGMVSLRLLNLRNNNIKVISHEQLAALAIYVQSIRNGSAGAGIIIDFRDNPLLCACASVYFLEWLFEYSNEANMSFECMYEGHVTAINRDIVSSSRYLCYKKVVIAVCVSLSISFAILTCVVIKVLKNCIAKRRRITKGERFLNIFCADKMEQKYLAFVAFSGHDEPLVQQSVLSPLVDHLERRLQTTRQVICCGADFQPGYTIVDETYRLVKLSCVFVAIVTESFCRSEFCRAELKEACTQDRPVVLVTTGRVPGETLTPFLQEVLRRQARATLVTSEDGRRQLRPSAGDMCDSLISLSADRYL